MRHSRNGIRRRFGAIGEHGSVAFIERVIRSMKSECTRQILVPFRHDEMRRELASYMRWYNEHRPHSGLGGRTPAEIYCDRPPANEAPRFEPRSRWPKRAMCARPKAPVKGEPGVRLVLQVNSDGGRAHLPVVALKKAA